MSKVSSIAVLLLLLLLLLAVQQLEADISCSDVLSDMSSPCIGFLLGDEEQPSGECCEGLSSLLAAAASTADRQDACECLKSAAGKDDTAASAALALPEDCGISLPYIISPDVDCSEIE